MGTDRQTDRQTEKGIRVVANDANARYVYQIHLIFYIVRTTKWPSPQIIVVVITLLFGQLSLRYAEWGFVCVCASELGTLDKGSYVMCN